MGEKGNSLTSLGWAGWSYTVSRVCGSLTEGNRVCSSKKMGLAAEGEDSIISHVILGNQPELSL